MSLRAAIAVLLCASRAVAQDRPSEGDIFGAPPPVPAVQAREDPLRIGGQLYLRMLGQWEQDVPPSQWSLSAPALADAYFDVRPNERVRGFLLARLQYDLARAQSDAPAAAAGAPGGIGGSGTSTLFVASQNPRMLLDQLWVNFDVGHALFVTAGKQHVKWGTGHFWNPTDYLHPVPRDPLAVFDARTGLTMVKLHLPWEKRGWNVYAMATFDESQAVGQVGTVGAGGRAEVVFGTVEVGIDGLAQKGKDARLGLDFSAGIWDFDVYGEAALRKGSDVTLYRPAGATIGSIAVGEAYEPQGLRPAATFGASWSYKYSDEDSVTLGGEYFYNANGYPDASLYPWLILQQSVTAQPLFTPFYLGQHYAGAYLAVPRPGRWNDTTFTFSLLGNFSDGTFVGRTDYSVLLLTYLTFEAYVAAHFGQRGGEFRFALDVPSMPDPRDPASTLPAIHVAPPVLDFGAALRVKL